MQRIMFEQNQDVIDEVERTRFKRTLHTLGRDWRLYVLLIPMLAFIFCFKYLPIKGLLTGFKWGNENDAIYSSQWCGLYWFNQIFFGASSNVFWRAFRNTFVNSMYGLLIGFPIPIILALLFSEVKTAWYRSVVQVCAYLPHFVSLTVVTTIIGLWCQGTVSAGDSNAVGGWIYEMCKKFGWLYAEKGSTDVLKDSILSYPRYFRPIYQISGVWEDAGYNSIVYFAAILAISPTNYEAARIDGATKLQQIRYITFPGMAPTLTLMLIMRIGQILNVGYEQIILLVGDYSNAWETADVVSTFVYRMSGQATSSGGAEVIQQLGIVADLFNSILAMFLVLGANAIGRRVSETSLF